MTVAELKELLKALESLFQERRQTHRPTQRVKNDLVRLGLAAALTNQRACGHHATGCDRWNGSFNMDLATRLDDQHASLIRQDDVRVETPFGSVPLRTFSLEVNGGHVN